MKLLTPTNLDQSVKCILYTSQKSSYSTKCECLSENFINNILVRATLIYSAFQL